MSKLLTYEGHVKQEFDERRILGFLRDAGFPKSEAVMLEEGEEAFADSVSYWYYDGPNDEKTRPFCRSLLTLDRYWKEDDIQFLSRKVGYNVMDFTGGINCRHGWRQARIKGRVQKGYSPKTPTRGQVDRAAVRQPSSTQDYFPL